MLRNDIYNEIPSKPRLLFSNFSLYEELKCGTQAKLKENLFPVLATKHKKPHYFLGSSVVLQKSRYQIFYKDLFISYFI